MKIDSYTRISSQCTKDLNTRSETVKLLEKYSKKAEQPWILVYKNYFYKISKAPVTQASKQVRLHQN